MAIETTIERRAAFVYVTLTGVFSVEDTLHSFRLALGACLESGLSRALIDFTHVTFDHPATTLERFDLGSHIAAEIVAYREQGLIRMQVAFLGREDQYNPERFVEIVARNRGGQVKATTSLAEALAWFGIDDDV